jgi:very-short-patch-repair endonuclease
MLNDSPQKSRRRLLRKKMTPAERTLWTKLRGYRFHGHRFHRKLILKAMSLIFIAQKKD